MYLEYRTWIRDWLKKMPNAGRGVLGKMASAIGSNSTLISQVMQGSRDFSIEQTYELASFFNFNPLETKYWMLLIQYERSSSPPVKEFFKRQIDEIHQESQQIKNRLTQQREMTDTEKALLVSSWRPTAIMIQSGNPEGISVEHLSNKLGIPLEKVKQYVLLLCEIGLLKKTGHLYSTGMTRLHIPKGSPYISRHYTNWRMKAIEQSEDIGDDELMFTSVASVAEKDIQRLKQKILSLISDYASEVSASAAEKVVCLNIDLFRVSKD